MQVLVRDNNVDQALRALKKKMQREGIFREMKMRGHYEKPSEKRAREKAEAVRRARKLARKRAQREGLLPRTPRPVAGGRCGAAPGALKRANISSFSGDIKGGVITCRRHLFVLPAPRGLQERPEPQQRSGDAKGTVRMHDIASRRTGFWRHSALVAVLLAGLPLAACQTGPTGEMATIEKPHRVRSRTSRR